MKTLRSATLHSISAAAILVGATIPFAAANAQTVAVDVATAARQACISSAESKGFQVVDVAAIEPKAGVADGANVVLNLTKAGQPYKLTCGYTKSAGAVFSDNAATTTTAAPTTTAPAATTETVKTTPPASLAPLWWLLLPLIGLPLLLWWTRGRGAAATATRGAYATGRTEAIVRNHGNPVNIYSGPGTDYRVTGSLQDGQTVWLSGQYNNNWAELEEGGWIPAQNVETAVARYAR